METTSLLRAAVIAAAIVLAGCENGKPKLPSTELPKLPPTAKIECEGLTDAEVIALLEKAETRAAGAKVEINCEYLRNLQKFVNNTWEERDGS